MPRTPPDRRTGAPAGRTVSSRGASCQPAVSRRARAATAVATAEGERVGERTPGPSAVWLVRHAESMGNVADARAPESGAGRLGLDVRDPDVPPSETGCDQAGAPGRRLARPPHDERPPAGLRPPLARALTTAKLATEPLGLPVRADERLRERDFGAFDGMTGAGIREEYPDEARRRDLLGKFYYRPPGGESWADVALRVRSLL